MCVYCVVSALEAKLRIVLVLVSKEPQIIFEQQAMARCLGVPGSLSNLGSLFEYLWETEWKKKWRKGSAAQPHNPVDNHASGLGGLIDHWFQINFKNNPISPRHK